MKWAMKRVAPLTPVGKTIRSAVDMSRLLTEAERDPPYLDSDAGLYEAADAFTRNPDLRLIPIVGAGHRPIGAIYERDVRRLLLNPFGHALMRNPAYGSKIDSHIRSCPTAEATLDLGGLLDIYRSSIGAEGMILTLDGRLYAVIANRRMVHIAAEREVGAARQRLDRAQRIEVACDRFESQIAKLVTSIDSLAGAVAEESNATVARAIGAGERAAAVAAAAGQTATNMAEIAERGRGLERALATISGNTDAARSSAAGAVALVSAGSQRTRELLRTAHSIDTVIALITEIATRVNLLALNATIEAARAGEAGRGFSIVANEVKSLSKQTGSAAAIITTHVRDIRAGIDEVVEGHAQIETAIGAIAQLAEEIRAAVGGQTEATRRVARNVEEAVEAGTSIQHDVETIGASSRLATERAQALNALAHRLSEGATSLAGEVASFLGEIRH